MLKPGDLHWRCGWLQMQLCAALHWYVIDCLLSFHILRLAFWAKFYFSLTFSQLLHWFSASKIQRYQKRAPRSCSVLGSVTALPFSFPNKLLACLVILACWVYTNTADNSMRMCLQKSPHSFLSLYYFKKQTGSFTACWTEIMFISKKKKKSTQSWS